MSRWNEERRARAIDKDYEMDSLAAEPRDNFAEVFTFTVLHDFPFYFFCYRFLIMRCKNSTSSLQKGTGMSLFAAVTSLTCPYSSNSTTPKPSSSSSSSSSSKFSKSASNAIMAAISPRVSHTLENDNNREGALTVVDAAKAAVAASTVSPGPADADADADVVVKTLQTPVAVSSIPAPSSLPSSVVVSTLSAAVAADVVPSSVQLTLSPPKLTPLKDAVRTSFSPKAQPFTPILQADANIKPSPASAESGTENKAKALNHKLEQVCFVFRVFSHNCFCFCYYTNSVKSK